MRNLAIELRKRQRAYAEERAQKAPVKVLFPILLLIMRTPRTSRRRPSSTPCARSSAVRCPWSRRTG